MRTAHVGLFFGAILGLALILESFGDMLIVALFGLVGWAVARVLEGDLDLNELLGSRRDRGGSGR
jgi:hypothetical protein